MANSAKQLALAREHACAGNHQHARTLFRRVLKREPGNAAAWLLLGQTLAESGDLISAAAAIVKAIQIGGPEPGRCCSLGRVLNRMGRHRDAAACFRQALAAEPLDAGIAWELGLALMADGQFGPSATAFEHVADLEPGHAAAWFQAGCAHYHHGNMGRAGECYRRLIELNPRGSQAHFSLGVVRMSERRWEDAIADFRRSIDCDSENAEAHNNLGLLLQDRGEQKAAADHFARAIRLKAGYYAAEYNRARLLLASGEIEQARDAYLEAVGRCPEHVDARLGLATSLVALNETREAVPHLRSAIELDPESIAAHLNLGIALLQLGQWEEGWRLYEWRFRRHTATAVEKSGRRWDGQSLGGKRLLLLSEQGAGDAIQFARFVPCLHASGAAVWIECSRPLVPLIESLDGLERVSPTGDTPKGWDHYHHLMSLPGMLGITPATILNDVPYVLADSELTERWADQLKPMVDPALLRVGLTWAGNPAHQNDRNRSMTPDLLNVLADVPGTVFFDLQKNPAGSPRLALMPMAAQCLDYGDTAAAIHNLDLVITVDTSVAHLAGALGKPVWTLLPFAADWRWMLDRTDTPWYPTMRLFRQRKRGDWGAVMIEVRAELEKLAGER